MSEEIAIVDVPSVPIEEWRPYTYLDPFESRNQCFYEIEIVNNIQFQNWKVECYSTIYGRLGRLVGEGEYQRRTRSYITVVNGRDTMAENYIGENSLYGYPIGPVPGVNFGIGLLFRLKSMGGRILKLVCQDRFEPFQNYGYRKILARTSGLSEVTQPQPQPQPIRPIRPISRPTPIGDRNQRVRIDRRKPKNTGRIS